jgi:hypothetical protein
MAASHLEPLLRQVQRRAIVRVVRSCTELTLEQLADLLETDGPRAALLGTVTVGELLAEPDPRAIQLPRDGGPPIDLAKLEAAQRESGPTFDECVCEAIAEADGRAIGASYLRARVGGPRWKLQSALGRLVEAGRVERSGTTSATRYRIADGRRENTRP